MLPKENCFSFSVHYDHQGVKARQESSKLILKKIKEIAGNERAIFVGDLNGGRNSEWYQTLASSDWLRDTYTRQNLFMPTTVPLMLLENRIPIRVIDHIFTTSGFTIDKWAVLTDTYHGKYPSDHFPDIG
jgi:endonuclease/exonuclease/phosphatase family metal-dependent hydrolase